MRFNFGAIWLFDCIHHKPPEENKIFFPTFPVKIFVWWGKMDGSIDRTKKAHINLDQLHDGGNSSFDSSAATSSSMQVWYKYLCAYLQHRPMRHINNDYATQYVQMWSWAVITVCSIVYWNVQCMSSINHLSKRFTIEPKTDQRCSGNHTSIIKRTQAEYYMMLLCIQFIPLHEQCCMKHQTRYTYHKVINKHIASVLGGYLKNVILK